MRRLIICFAALPVLAGAQPDAAKAGPEIIAEAFGKLVAALTEAIEKGGTVSAIAVCTEKAPEIAATVGKSHGVTVRRASGKPRNPDNAATEAERTLLSAFARDMDEKRPPRPQTVTHPDGRITFHAPILMASPLCLQCHGSVQKDIPADTLTAIRKLYPDDRATGYKSGELRGTWSVTFPAKP